MIALTERQREGAERIGLWRLADAVANGRERIGHREGDDLARSYIRGAVMECAFYHWLGGIAAGARWHTFKPNATREDLRRPDIVLRRWPIDVKGRPANWEKFIVRCGSVNPRHVYVFACDRTDPVVTFHGWIEGAVLLRKPLEGRYNIPGHAVTPDDADLRDCFEIPWSF